MVGRGMGMGCRCLEARGIARRECSGESEAGVIEEEVAAAARSRPKTSVANRQNSRFPNGGAEQL